MKTVELPINEVSKSHSATEMNNLVEREAQMVQADKLENERINAKVSVNMLETCAYFRIDFMSERIIVIFL